MPEILNTVKLFDCDLVLLPSQKRMGECETLYPLRFVWPNPPSGVPAIPFFG